MMDIVFAVGLTFIAGASTVFGGLFYSRFQGLNNRYFSYFIGLSAGAMLTISVFDLFPTAVNGIGFMTSFILMGGGALLAKLVDFVVPHHITFPVVCDVKTQKMMTTGLVVAIGMIIHNIPEGMAVFMGSLHDKAFGTVLAIATGIHNIPEGIAVAAPILCATKNKTLALRYTLIAGLAEPFGALITFFLLRPYLTDKVLSSLFALVAGVMIFISFDELLPWSIKDKQYTQAFGGIVTGGLILGVSLWLFG
jgi:ZIP family zinc transporter